LASEDVFLAAYPRSGSTWLRFLMFEILTCNSAGFPNVNRSIPDVGGQWKALPLLPGEARLIKTHEPYRKEYHRAIYLVRDARDVVISEHYYHKAMGWTTLEFGDYLLSFLRGEVNGYGAWHDHVEAWLRSPLAENGNLLVIRFEDMRRNTEENLGRVLDFLRVEADPQVVQEAIANNSVRRMRDKEDSSPQIPKISRNPSTREDGRFIRRGSVGGWRERLTAAQTHSSRSTQGTRYGAWDIRSRTHSPGRRNLE